ncbi:MAG: inorganic phosphate transporter [Desulfosudis oleivorans]|nr:inorganic phosphate transporter [Desulfosudis oleivorans]
MGGLLGAAIAHTGLNVVNMQGVLEKVLIPMITSPVIGLIVGFNFMLLLIWLFKKANPDRINKRFRNCSLFHQE